MEQTSRPQTQNPEPKENNNKWQKPLLCILAALLLAGIVGYGVYAWQQNEVNQLSAKLDSLEEQTTSQVENNKVIDNNDNDVSGSEETLSGAEVIDLGDKSVLVISVDDLSKLPDKTPESFITYMKNILAKNTSDEENNCVSQYEINKISNVNVVGGVGGVSASNSNERCGGGAGQMWYKVGDGWNVLAFQNPISCERVETAVVYSEFVSQCLEGSEFVENPNGSLVNKFSE